MMLFEDSETAPEEKQIKYLESYRALNIKFYVEEFNFNPDTDTDNGRTTEWTDAIYISNNLAYLSKEQLDNFKFGQSI